MPKDKIETYHKILPAGKEEFLDKGFEQASMRSIAQKAGVSAAGIYRHFVDKEDMFGVLVEPAMNATNEWFQRCKENDYVRLEQDDFDSMWSGGTNVDMITQVVYPNYDAFKLLICRAQGTKYANFIHELVMLEQTETLEFLRVAQERGRSVKKIIPEELHLLLSAYISAIFEVVVHDFSLEDAKHYIDTVENFFYPGWRNILGL